MTVTIPQGDSNRITPAPVATLWPMDTSPEAVRLDVATLGLAFAEAQHRALSTEETALRLTAAQVTFDEAKSAYWEDTWPL